MVWFLVLLEVVVMGCRFSVMLIWVLVEFLWISGMVWLCDSSMWW